MAITILPPSTDRDNEESPSPAASDYDSSDNSMEDAEDERPAKRARLSKSTSKIVTPGEIITDDTQWMR